MERAILQSTLIVHFIHHTGLRAWVRRHCGVNDDEIVDMLAKEAAQAERLTVSTTDHRLIRHFFVNPKNDKMLYECSD